MPVVALLSILGVGGAFTLGYGTAKTTDKWVTYAVVLGAGFVIYKTVGK